MPDLTRLIEAAAGGDRDAADQLLPLVYDELRKLAAAKMATENPGHTLDATALVHEAYLRLVGDQQFDGRGHFFAAAAEAMRRILIDRARTKQSERRGGARRRVPLMEIPTADDAADDLIDLDAALRRLTADDAPAAAVAKLRLFVGLSVEEAGDALGLSRATAFRHWTYARAWLRDALSDRSA
jgi:RNA polymerase sigma factor (TIGR02999 family)